MNNPLIKSIVLPEQIPPERVTEWHKFLLSLPMAWWDDKTPEQRGVDAVKLWKEVKG